MLADRCEREALRLRPGAPAPHCVAAYAVATPGTQRTALGRDVSTREAWSGTCGTLIAYLSRDTCTLRHLGGI